MKASGFRKAEDEVTIHYTMPMPPADKEEEKISVLPIGYRGRPTVSIDRTTATVSKAVFAFI